MAGSLAVLQRAKAQGLLPSVKELLDSMVAQGLRISKQLYVEALTQSGEAS
ncbi:DUF3368 domain-containing protein [Candidatus Acetothermia bacterium]|nr:DUF3368 domain-containing protein [Candidatus Acetothermia bacterium]MBI3660110.1 DUF3368 domain-containing protein [Candidatus Acetothermia bacterium]